jgi:phosphatidate cytidylyltransferase
VFLTCVKFCDIGAYFTGRFLGRHLWVPSISPKKTWEGFFGGIVIAVIAASLFAQFSAIMGIGRAVVFGVVAAVTGQLGDLLESMLKRDAGSKDSASLIPEFGGVLDLLDSVLVAAPFAYLVLAWP